ncbi:MAG TPA: hypothetical protein PKY82_29805 [Pyrinomonadaceae bacterium]|nr:hypothetical protein [Pyrinomonadaceae bacterium]
MPKFCEQCKKRVVVIRRIRKGGRFFGRYRIYSDRFHSLCFRHRNSLVESEKQRQKTESDLIVKELKLLP